MIMLERRGKRLKYQAALTDALKGSHGFLPASVSPVHLGDSPFLPEEGPQEGGRKRGSEELFCGCCRDVHARTPTLTEHLRHPWDCESHNEVMPAARHSLVIGKESQQDD